MQILICPDKFKGSLSASKVGKAIKRGIHQQFPGAKINIHPMADGGDGSLAVLAERLELQPAIIETQDPLRRPIRATYYHDNAKSAYIELAAASGIALLDESELNPLRTTTLGTGLQIRTALNRGFTQLYLFLGGSATHDLGLGIAQALGYRFLSVGNEAVFPVGGNLQEISQILPPDRRLEKNVRFTLLCDVKNSLLGAGGAASIYAPQKGANVDQVKILEDGSQSSSGVIERFTGQHISSIAGGGAAGGVAAGLTGLFNAEIKPGFATISELTGLEMAIQQADIVISGEGKLDTQSLEGKVVSGVAELCRKLEKPLHLFTGAAEITEAGLSKMAISSLQTIMSQANNLDDAIANPITYLERLATEWAKINLR